MLKQEVTHTHIPTISDIMTELIGALLGARVQMIIGLISGSIGWLFLTITDVEAWVKLGVIIVASLAIPGVKIYLDIREKSDRRKLDKEKHELEIDRMKEEKFFSMLQKMKENGISFDGMTPEEIFDKVKEYLGKF